jgi:hypothetical protein
MILDRSRSILRVRTSEVDPVSLLVTDQPTSELESWDSPTQRTDPLPDLRLATQFPESSSTGVELVKWLVKSWLSWSRVG